MATAIGDLVATMRINTSPFQSGVARTKANMKQLDSTIVSSMRRWGAEAKKMAQASETPLLRYNRRIREANKSLLAGSISVAEYTTSVANLDGVLAHETAAQTAANAATANAVVADKAAAVAAKQKATADALVASRLTVLSSIQKRASSVMVASLTPLQLYQKEIAELNVLQSQGIITATQNATAQKQLAIVHGQTAAAVAASAKTRRTARLAAVGRFGAKAAGGAALVGVVSTALAARQAEGFNQAMNSSLAIMQDVNAEMRADMKRTAFEIARVTKFSGTEAAESYFFLASAGLDAKQSIAALPVVAQFAQAGMFDMAQATDLLTDAQSALGKTVKDPIKNLQNMTKLGDQLVKANTLANASVEQFSESLTNKAAASMRLLNIETAEGIAVLAAFADQGIKGSEAGTAFSIVLRDLTTKAIKESEAFKALGVNVFDASGDFQKMSDIIGDLEVALFGLSDEQKKATLLQLGFSDKSVQFTQVLLGMSDKIRDYERGINEAGGTMKRVADSQLTPFAKGMAAVGAAFSEFSVDSATGPMAELGKAMEDLAKPGGDLITMLNSIVDAIDAMNTEVLKASKGFAESLVRGPSGEIEDVSKGALRAIGLDADKLINTGPRPTSTFIEQLDVAIAAREKATAERLATRARGGAPEPLSAAKRFAEFQKESQILADRQLQESWTDAMKIQELAGNIERAKSMEVIAANEKAAEKIREGFVDSPLKVFQDRMAELNKLSGAPGGLSAEEFQRAAGDARKASIEAMKSLPENRAGDAELKTAQSEVERIRQGLMTPLDRLTENILRTRELTAVPGGLTETEAEKEIARLQKEAAGGAREPITPTAGRIAERGTDVAFQAILAAMTDDTVDDAIKETAGNTKTSAELLADIDANLSQVGIGDA